MADKEDDVIGVEEAVTMLGVTKPTLYRYIRQGLITQTPQPSFLKKRARAYFRRGDVERLRAILRGEITESGE